MEIEHKWLVDPTYYNYLSNLIQDSSSCVVSRKYLVSSDDCEVRVDCILGLSSYTREEYNVTVKYPIPSENSNLVRGEIISSVSKNKASSLLNEVPYHPIIKLMTVGKISLIIDYSGTTKDYEVFLSVVDPGTEETFNYFEIEFKDLIDANYDLVKLNPNLSFLIEVTDDKYWSMNNYWNKTRLMKKGDD